MVLFDQEVLWISRAGPRYALDDREVGAYGSEGGA